MANFSFYSLSVLQPVGYGIRTSPGNALTLRNVCFLNNDFTGNGTVLIEDGATFSFSDTYASPQEDLECQFAAITGADGDITCTDYDGDAENCGSTTPAPVPVGSTTPAPVPGASNAPSPAPSTASGSAAASFKAGAVAIMAGILPFFVL